MKERQSMTGYPSVDKPWLKYYSEDAINAPIPEMSMYQYILAKNKYNMEDTALFYFHSQITYKMLFDEIDIASKAFIKIGVKAGDIVAVALPNIPENVYCIYALNKIGAIVDLIDLRAKGDTLIHYLSESKATTAVVCDLFADNVYQIIDQTNLSTVIVASPFDSMRFPIKQILKWKHKNGTESAYAMSWAAFSKQGEDGEAVSCGKSEDIACIFHTSGTTGFPKGVMLTNRNCNAMALQGEVCGLPFKWGERIMNQVPPFLAFNVVCSLHLPLALHMKMMILPEYRPDKFAENIVKTKATCCLAGPADWENFLENQAFATMRVDLSCLVNPICGSDALATSTRKEINKLLKAKGCKAEILEGYGMTEIGAAACCNMPGHVVDGSVGIPFNFNTFCIYDSEKEEELSYGQTGEICMRGPTVMKGYFNNPEETSKVLRMHNDGLLWLHSGDAGRIDENGYVFLEGRIKRIIVRYDGIKISPFLLEKIISSSPDVSACCVVGAPDYDHGHGQVPVAFVVPTEGKIDLKTIQRKCESELSETYWPKEYRFLDHLPLTQNGKVDYRALESDIIA